MGYYCHPYHQYTTCYYLSQVLVNHRLTKHNRHYILADYQHDQQSGRIRRDKKSQSFIISATILT